MSTAPLAGRLGYLLSLILFLIGSVASVVSSCLLACLPSSRWQTALHLIYAPLCLLLPPKFASPESFIILVAGSGNSSAFTPDFEMGRPSTHPSYAVSI